MPSAVALRTQVSKDIFDLAREMAELMASRPEVIALRQSEDALLADAESVRLVREYEDAKRAVKRTKGLPKEEQMKAIMAFMPLEDSWNENPLIQAYWAARENMDRLMENLNQIITFPLHGDEEWSGGRKTGCSGGDSGGCSCGSGG